MAPVGIGADRYETAKILLAQFPATDVLLLDDGFQHAQMRRDIDIVVLDGLDPFGQEEVVPLGRLREPLQVLSRAHAFVVTRAEAGPRYEAICARLREYNPAAPIFRTRLLARHWCDYGTGNAVELSLLAASPRSAVSGTLRISGTRWSPWALKLFSAGPSRIIISTGTWNCSASHIKRACMAPRFW